MKPARERISVKAIPSSGRREVVGWLDGFLKVKLQTAPEGGKANRELIQLLAKAAACRKGDVKLIGGEKNRVKLVELPLGEKADPVLRNVSA